MKLPIFGRTSALCDVKLMRGEEVLQADISIQVFLLGFLQLFYKNIVNCNYDLV